MRRKARKALHNQIKNRYSRPSTNSDWWYVSLSPYLVQETQRLEWGVIIKDIYENHTFAEFHSPDKLDCEDFANNLEQRLTNNEEIYWENYANFAQFHNSMKLGYYYLGNKL